VPRALTKILIVGGGAAGLIAARDLARVGRKVTLLEARDRCGGRIAPLSIEEFGYAAEGGAEFVHGDAPITTALLRESGLSLAPVEGSRLVAQDGRLSPNVSPFPYADLLHQALAGLKTDLPIAEFLQTRFGDARYGELRRRLLGMIEGYDAADPARASTFALRDEWMETGLRTQGRVAEGYGALVKFLEGECRRQEVSIHLDAVVTAIADSGGHIAARLADGAVHEADAAIVTVPPRVLADITLPEGARAKAAAFAGIGYGNVVKILLRFRTKWWADLDRGDLADLSFVLSNAQVPTWWSQHPAAHPVLTGWLGGPKANDLRERSAGELVEIGLASLAEVFGVAKDRVTGQLVASRAINWGNDPFARGAYSYATPETREAQAALKRPDGALVLFSGEALYAGRDMGTVEAALASGRETAEMILG
jgi:monoamine oxidase